MKIVKLSGNTLVLFVDKKNKRNKIIVVLSNYMNERLVYFNFFFEHTKIHENKQRII